MSVSMSETKDGKDLLVSLYDKYKQGLFVYICKYLDSPEDAEDVVHEVFLMLAEGGLGKLAGRNEKEISRFMFISAKNIARVIARKKRKTVSFEEFAEPYEPIPHFQAAELFIDRIIEEDLLEKAEAAMKTLDPKYADILYLYFKGLKVKELAEEYHARPETMRKRIYRALNALRNEVYKGDE